MYDSGYSHMEMDGEYSVIERTKNDWFHLVRSYSSRFRAVEMRMNFSDLQKGSFIMRKRDEQDNVFKCHDVKWLRYSSENFDEIMYKTTLEESSPFHTLCNRRRGTENREFTVNPITDKPVSINPEKMI